MALASVRSQVSLNGSHKLGTMSQFMPPEFAVTPTGQAANELIQGRRGAPMASIVVPPVRVEVPIAAQVGLVPAPPETVPDVSSVIVPVDDGAIITPAAPRTRWLSLPALLVSVWIAGAAIFALPIAAGLWQMRTMRRSW